MEIFSATEVVKRYANHLALDKVSLTVGEGSIYGLLGPNGAGKTTLIRIITQITAPDEGSIKFMGKAMSAEDVSHFGYLPEERGLYRKMKVGEQAIYLAMLKGLSKQEALRRLKIWFEKFEMQSWWNKKVEELSKGMQQKVQFLTTIVHEPRVVIFDEPFSGFDPINQNMLKEEILALKQKGTTIFFSTHNMASVEELCDDITLINKSKTILSGNMNSIKNTYKSNTYEVTFSGNPENLKSTIRNDQQLLSLEQKNNHWIARIKLASPSEDNSLLSQLLQSIHIISFIEILPSMSDIFIQLVEKANHQNLN
jgi:ABC-2 type transport system ATP-binding protein